MDPQTLSYILAAVLVVIGLFGTVLPALPGLPLVFAGMLLAAWAGDFQHIGGWTIAILGVLTALSLLVDLLAGALGAKRVGASGLAVLGAALGTLVGLFLGLPGLIVGPFVGAMVGELIHGREPLHAGRVGFATWLGMVIGAIVKLALAFAMLGVFALALLF